jgi:hypothetical protein
MHECKTWSSTLREEQRLRVFEYRVLKRIFGPKDEGLAGGWRRLHNEELHNFVRSKSWWTRWAGHVAHMRISTAYNIYSVNRKERNIFYLRVDGRVILE